jgi:hypothetical protein
MVERKHKLFFKNNIFYLIILYKKIKNKIKKNKLIARAEPGWPKKSGPF